MNDIWSGCYFPEFFNFSFKFFLYGVSFSFERINSIHDIDSHVFVLVLCDKGLKWWSNEVKLSFEMINFKSYYFS